MSLAKIWRDLHDCSTWPPPPPPPDDEPELLPLDTPLPELELDETALDELIGHMSDADMDAMFPLMTDQELDALLGNDSEDDSEVGAGEAGVAADPPADKPGP